MVVHTAFWIACMLGPGAACLVLVLSAVYGPGQIKHPWVIPLLSALLIPLYFARKLVSTRINEVRQGLEQMNSRACNDEPSPRNRG